MRATIFRLPFWIVYCVTSVSSTANKIVFSAIIRSKQYRYFKPDWYALPVGAILVIARTRAANARGRIQDSPLLFAR